jgi:hypothetical protein
MPENYLLSAKSQTPLVIAFVVVIVLFFGGGVMTDGLMNGRFQPE